MKEGLRNYRIYLRELHHDKSLSKREQMSQLAQRYAEQLEAIVRRYPTQWFNYFDFWKQ
jgi:predicted LPLAT superfamily acyltransferase